MTKEDPWFFEERAVAFASLLLTKRHDVIVRPHVGADRTVDLLVEIRTDCKSTPRRRFGVQIAAWMDLPDRQNADERIHSRFRGHHLETEFPLCAFVIGVRKPEGVCRWAVEPVVEDGRALLRRVVDGAWQTLDEAGAARLIDQVSAWYDALNAVSTPKGRGRRSKTPS